eukprot:541287-Amphidinium_carterae.1
MGGMLWRDRAACSFAHVCVYARHLRRKLFRREQSLWTATDPGKSFTPGGNKGIVCYKSEWTDGERIIVQRLQTRLDC